MSFVTGLELLVLTVASAIACHCVANGITPGTPRTICQGSVLVETCSATFGCALLGGSFIVAIAFKHSNANWGAKSRANMRI